MELQSAAGNTVTPVPMTRAFNVHPYAVSPGGLWYLMGSEAELSSVGMLAANTTVLTYSARIANGCSQSVSQGCELWMDWWSARYIIAIQWLFYSLAGIHSKLIRRSAVWEDRLSVPLLTPQLFWRPVLVQFWTVLCDMQRVWITVDEQFLGLRDVQLPPRIIYCDDQSHI